MKTEWDFSEIKTDFKKERKKIEEVYESFREKWINDKSYLEDPKKLKEALDEIEEISEKYSKGGNEGYFYWLNQELNQNDVEARKKFLKVEDFLIKQAHKVIFFSISLSKISPEKQKEFLDNPLLKKYHRYLEELFLESKYILSEKEEKVLDLKENTSYEMWVRMVSSLLAKETRESINEKGEKKEYTYEELINLMRSEKKEVRFKAKIAFEEILQKYEEVAEFELNAVLEDAKIDDELRGYNFPDESRIKGDLIDEDFVNSLLDAVREKFSITRDFYHLKAKLMGEKKIGYFERSATIKKVEKEYPSQEAVNLVREVFGNLDKEFLEIFDRMLNTGKLDFFPKKGKRGGAFCVHFRRNQPVYVLLNHTGKLRDVAVIAHEMGHAINNEFMKKQSEIYYDAPLSTAEVASTFFEDFVYKKVFETLSDEGKFYLKIQKFEDDFSSIQRQIALYLFEREIHKIYRDEGYLSKEKIGELFVKHMSEYLGEAVDMENAHLWWIYWSHIRECFYVYSYASGLIISKAMQKKLREDKKFIEKVKTFLSSGTSKKPREIFKEMGIEINKEFFLEGLSELEKELEEIKEIGKKLGKI